MFREREIWEKSSFSRASSEKMAYLKFSIWKNNIPWRWKLWTKGPNLFIKLCSARLDTSLICLHRIKYSLTSPLCQHHYESSTAQQNPLVLKTVSIRKFVLNLAWLDSFNLWFWQFMVTRREWVLVKTWIHVL